MIQINLFCIMIIIIIINNIVCTTHVGYIRNASYISNSTKMIMTYQNTCSECICNGFFSVISAPYVRLNCYQNNKTCELFMNYSTSFTITINPNSTFISIQQPPVRNITTSKYRYHAFIIIICSHISTRWGDRCWLWKWYI